MPLSQISTPQLAIFKTKPIGPDGNLVYPWQQFFQSVVQTQNNSPKAYMLTRAQRLALITSNVNIGSLVFETDTKHVFVWFQAWVQLV